MDRKSPNEIPKKSVSGRVPLDDIEFGCTKLYNIGELQWSVRIGVSTTHIYNQIEISTSSLDDDDRCHVEFEVYAPKYLPNRMMFWHIFDDERNTFCIPYASEEEEIYWKSRTTNGTLQTGRRTGSYLRISLNPKVWRYRNWQFPFADLVLRVGNEELYVNRKILCSTSRFFLYIMENSRVKCMKTHEVLHVYGVSFEDLFDLIGWVYHGWLFHIDRAMHLQEIAEQFGVRMDANNAEIFEGRTSMEISAQAFYDRGTEKPTVWSNYPPHRIRRLRRTSEESFDSNPDLHLNINPRLRNTTPESVSSSMSMNSSVVSSRSSITDPASEPHTAPQSPEPIDERNDEPGNGNNEEARMGRLNIRDTHTPGTEFREKHRKDGRTYYSFAFDFDLNYSEKYTKGGKYSIQTCCGSWDFYMYFKKVNYQNFLALGIYVTHMPQSFCDMIVQIEARGGNLKPTKKILHKVMATPWPTLGYPTFMPWSDVQNYGNDTGKMAVAVQLGVKMVNYYPSLQYDLFPGRKDMLVMIEQSVFPVSRDVLSEASPDLRRWFTEDVLINRDRVYHIHDINYTHFMCLLNIIYNRSRTMPEDIEPLMEHAQRFEMQFVIDQLCRDFVVQKDLEEMEVWRFAEKFGLKTLMYKYYSQKASAYIDPSNTLIRKE